MAQQEACQKDISQEEAQLLAETLADESRPTGKKHKIDMTLWQQNLDTYYNRKDVEIPLEENRFQFDLQATMGQSRAFSVTTFEERLLSFRQEL